jgi:hypothetical protein
MALPYIVAGIGIGIYIKGGSLKEVGFWAGATYLGAYAITHPIQSTVMVARGAKYGFTSSIQTMSADFLAAGPTQLVAGAAFGYALGAVTGTVIVHVAEEKGLVKEGSTAEVLDFYMGKGHYWEQGSEPTPGYFNIPGNLKYIWENARD